ncbi:MAG: PA14 domain-containing protein, partial [Planctomycetota bacterium]
FYLLFLPALFCLRFFACAFLPATGPARKLVSMRTLLRLLGMALLVVMAGLPSLFASPTLDPSFSRWLEKNPKVHFAEVAQRFLTAAGRDATAYQEQMQELEKRFREYLILADEPNDPKDRCLLLGRFFFEKLGFEADLDLQSLENLYPDAILKRRRGYCLGLSLVILHLAEQIGWPLQAASAPRHTFVRYAGPPHVNLETTLGGELHDDAWYQERFSFSRENRGYLTSMTERQTAAHLLNNYGFVLLNSGRLPEAAKHFKEALKIHPELVEAIINQGVCHARLRDYKAALKAFDAALSKWPGDPYTRLNRANALLSLKSSEAAEAALTKLLNSHPTFPGLSDALDHLRSILDTRKNWHSVQRLSIAQNQSRAVLAGKLPGLKATYYKDTHLRSPCATRVDRNISFRWGWGSPGRRIPKDRFSTRWIGWLEIPRKDRYTFFITCSDGVRLWVDGRQVVNAWSRTNNNFTEGSVQLLAGLHDLRVEYFESNGDAGIKVMLAADSQEAMLELSDHIFHAP